MNIFKDDAPEVYYLKQFIRHKLINYLDEGLEWVLIQGQMGIELWTAQVVIELKAQYPELKLAIITPFEGHTQRWNEQNQLVYNQLVAKADYVDSIYHSQYKGLFSLNRLTALCWNILI